MTDQLEAAHVTSAAMRSGATIERVVRKRFGICLFVGLVTWPLIGFWPAAEALVANALLLDTYYQLCFLTIVNVIAFFFCFAILRLQNKRFGSGFLGSVVGAVERPWKRERIAFVLGLALLAPVVLAALFGSEFPAGAIEHFVRSCLSIMVGAFIGLGVLGGLGRLKSFLFGSDEETANYYPFESDTGGGLESLNALTRAAENAVKRIGLRKIDIQFAIYLSMLAALHYGSARLFEAHTFWLTSAPSMLVVVIWLSLMLLAGLSNLLDPIRVPVTLTLLAIIAALQAFRGATSPLNTVADGSSDMFVRSIAKIHAAETESVAAGQPVSERAERIKKGMEGLDNIAWNAIRQRMDFETGAGKRKMLVVVTCPGGGIHAAAWSACVLDQLSTEYEEFSQSLAVISGVSGGSIGTLFFVSSRYSGAFSPPRSGVTKTNSEETHNMLSELSPALELAARSSLESIAYGVTVGDLFGLVGFPGKGRGQLLEDSFVQRLPPSQRYLSMGAWGEKAKAGALPIVIFNSTDAVSGRRILFDTIPTHRRASSVGLTARPLNYRELMLTTESEAYDVSPATAARTSATFPYVSPYTSPGRASQVGKSVAICDGGFVDNEGIVTAVNWIEFSLNKWKKVEGEKPFDQILLLRIEPSYSVDSNQPPESGGLAGWFRWLTGPAETMIKVRSASQLERGNLEADLVAKLLSTVADDGRAQQQTVSALETSLAKSTPPQARENWDRLLDGFSIKSKEDFQKYSPKLGQEPAGQADRPSLVEEIADETNQDSGSSPGDVPAEWKELVVTQTVRFPAGGQTIPLNWKLSDRQKRGYLLAWKICAAEGTPLREHLDSIFTRTQLSPADE